MKPILHSMIAEQYWNYYQNNRYRFLRRTQTVEFKQEDMRTWDLKKIVEQVILHFKDEGIEGIEVLYPMHSWEQTCYLERIARKFQLLLTGGSDFHGEQKPKVLIGKRQSLKLWSWNPMARHYSPSSDHIQALLLRFKYEELHAQF